MIFLAVAAGLTLLAISPWVLFCILVVAFAQVWR